MPLFEFTIVVDPEVTYETDGSVTIGKKDAEFCIRGQFLTELLKNCLTLQDES